MPISINLSREVVNTYKAAKKDDVFHKEYNHYSNESITDQFPYKWNLSDKADGERLVISSIYAGWLLGKGLYKKDMFK
jgi:hypothetical protein